MSKPIDVAGTCAPFVHPITVRWGDCDPAKIAYTGRLPNFALESIDAWWMATTHFDWYQLNVDRNVGTPFVHMSLDFRAPVTPRHTLMCEVSLIKIGKSSVCHRVVGRQNDVVCFEGEFVAVFVDAAKMETSNPPSDILERLQSVVRPS